MNRSCLIGLLLVPGRFVSAGEADVLAVPAGISEVIIRARDSLHQYGGRELVVKVRE
jgi:hypothetical protein